MREHRVGTLAWVVGGAAAMLFMGLALHEEMASFPGGPEALARSVTPAAEAMRVLRWPAEHLETLGGYLTFHNVTLVSGFLALYAALQGARLVRGPEEGHALEQVLATGWSRPAYLRDRALGFLVVLSAVTLGIAAGIAWALAASDVPDLPGSLMTMAAVGAGALVAFGLGVLVSQLMRSARSARGVAALLLVAMYLANNAVDPGDALGWIRFLTVFHWVNRSRALVPGYVFDVGAVLVLLVAAAALLGLSALAFGRRDYGAGLWAGRTRAPAAPERGRGAARRWWLRSPWTASLHEHRIGLLAWVLAGTAFAALMMLLQPAAIEVFQQFSYYLGMVGGEGSSADAMYATMATDILAPLGTAFVITQSAGWVADLEQGRVETLLSAPLSWTGLVWQRLLACGIGVVTITAAYLAVIAIGSSMVAADVSVAGLARVGVVAVLLAWAVAALATLAVVALRNAVAVTILAAYVAFAYLLTWMIPMFGWPTWTERLSIFAAFAHPYREWPPAGSLLLLVAVAVGGSLLGALLAERTPKVA